MGQNLPPGGANAPFKHQNIQRGGGGSSKQTINQSRSQLQVLHPSPQKASDKLTGGPGNNNVFENRHKT